MNKCIMNEWMNELIILAIQMYIEIRIIFLKLWVFYYHLWKQRKQRRGLYLHVYLLFTYMHTQHTHGWRDVHTCVYVFYLSVCVSVWAAAAVLSSDSPLCSIDCCAVLVFQRGFPSWSQQSSSSSPTGRPPTSWEDPSTGCPTSPWASSSPSCRYGAWLWRGPHFSSHLLTLLSAPSDVRRVLLLPGVRQHLSVGGRLRVRGDPRDQEQDLHGDQPHVLQEGAGGGDAGPDERGPAAAEEDERLRRSGAHVAGVWQLFITQVASTRDHVQVLNCAETCRI